MKLPFYIQEAKFTRPRLAQHIIERPQLAGKLREALYYPLTLVRAGAGYGKSTLINQAFPESEYQMGWLHLSSQEKEPVSFLLQTIHAVERVASHVSSKALSMLAWDERQSPPDVFAVASYFADEMKNFIEKDLLIIFDDYQWVSDSPEVVKLTQHLLDILPDKVHVIIASRQKILLPGLALTQAKGEILTISEHELAFKDHEIKDLFSRSYGLKIDDDLAELLIQRTEGWVMAIHMLAQHVNKGSSWEAALSALPKSLKELFEYLARDYLMKQPKNIRKFLRYTAQLQLLTTEVCDYMLDIEDSETILQELEYKGLFTFYLGDGIYRYHQLFKEFLVKLAGIPLPEVNPYHFKAAEYYNKNGLHEFAVEHFLTGGYFREAGLLIQGLYQQQLMLGRQAKLEGWLGLLPADIMNELPKLLLCKGDVQRLSGDFSGAFKYYSSARKLFCEKGDVEGEYLAAKAFALIYLDTVQPVLAEQYLTTALALVDSARTREKAQLYQLMAENNVNLGQSEQASTLFRKANELFLEDSRGNVEARMHLRTGRLLTAKDILSRQAESTSQHVPKSHRETSLLLSLINAFMGEVDEALANAQAGLHIGVQLRADFVQAVSYMRIGHATQLRSWTDMQEALGHYQQALSISSRLGVERGKAEPLWGLCLLYGHHGQLDCALRYGIEGLQLSQQAKDDWIAALIELSLAIAYYKAGLLDKALEWALLARDCFVRCGDSYLSTVAKFWLARILLDKGGGPAFREGMESLLSGAQSHDYDFIFYKPTLMGLRDAQASIPLLLAAQRENIHPEYVGALLTELGLKNSFSTHPGFTLRVQTLGAFQAWRGIEEIKARDWQREKAKRLFQYFITQRKKLVQKEEAIDAIWGECGTDSDFKVAMNAMVTALEPGRHARKSSFFISRQDTRYGLNLAAGILIDVDEFEGYITRADRIVTRNPEEALRLYRMALKRYQGDFLQECCYDDWCKYERERLLVLYLTTAEKLAVMLYNRGETEECIGWAMQIISKDRCWEAAYRLLMRCYHLQDNRAMITRIYKQCRDNLRLEIGVQPGEETSRLFRSLSGMELINV